MYVCQGCLIMHVRMCSEPVFYRNVELHSNQKKLWCEKKIKKILPTVCPELLREHINIRINNVLTLRARFQVMKTLPVISSVSNQRYRISMAAVSVGQQTLMSVFECFLSLSSNTYHHVHVPWNVSFFLPSSTKDICKLNLNSLIPLNWNACGKLKSLCAASEIFRLWS